MIDQHGLHPTEEKVTAINIGSKCHETSMTVTQFCLIQLSLTKVAIAYCLSWISSDLKPIISNEKLVAIEV